MFAKLFQTVLHEWTQCANDVPRAPDRGASYLKFVFQVPMEPLSARGTAPLVHCLRTRKDGNVTREFTMKDLFRLRCARPTTGILLGALAVTICSAQTPARPSADDLEQRIDKLETEVRDLKSQLAAAKESADMGKDHAVARGQASAAGVAAASSPAPSLSGLLGPTTLSGLVDIYYGYNANQPASRESNLRSFDTNANQFALNLVELQVDKPPEPGNSRTGYRVALGFGQAMNAVNGSDPGGLGFDQYLKEAYFSYLAPAGKGLQVDIGKFVTPHGAEVIETKDNWNYSRGLLFSYAIPYFHFGMRGKYAFNDKYSLSGFLVNGWNNVVDNNGGKTYGLGLGWNPTRKISFTQNYMAGPEGVNNNTNWRQLWDTVVTYSPNSRLTLMANSDYGRGDRMAGVTDPVFWTGVAGYARYAFNPRYALAARYEHYDDRNGFTTGTAQHLDEFTGTLQRNLGEHILGRLEFRRDLSNRPTFERGTGMPSDAQNTVTAGMVFVFESREGK